MICLFPRCWLRGWREGIRLGGDKVVYEEVKGEQDVEMGESGVGGDEMEEEEGENAYGHEGLELDLSCVAYDLFIRISKVLRRIMLCLGE